MPRTGTKHRCQRCLMRIPLCLCAELPGVVLSTRLVILMHYREVNTTTNTGRLATLALSNSEIRVRGQLNHPMSTEGLVSSTGDTLLLYPTDEARELTPELVASMKRPFTLIVPDGTWRQAGKVAYREPVLAKVPRVRLIPGPPSGYGGLRRGPNPQALSTVEAIARAMGVLEGPETRAMLERVFDLMVTRTLWSKGKLSSEAAGDRVPAEAILDRASRG